MALAVDGVASDVERLNERVQELERRVSALECQPGTSHPAAPQLSESVQEGPHSLAAWLGSSPADTAGGAFPVLGKAVLGIAGAYLLRALAESGAIPQLPVLIVAIVYAGLWMVYAVRTHAANRFASATYGVTSVLILSPLLWESTVRFQALAPALAAVVLVAFVVLAFALSWRRNLQLIPWVATLAAVITALALIIATRELVPLTAALLAVALAAEIAACVEHRLSLRAVPALAADFAVWLLVYVMTSSDGVPEEYHPVSAATITLLCLILFAIYGGSIGIRAFALRRRMTVFEIAQGILAFGLAAFGAMRASHGAAAPALGIFFLLLAAVCYWGTLSRFTDEAYTRDRRVFATYAAVLLLAGSYVLFSPNLRVPFLCLAAVATAFVYAQTGKLSLGLHTSFYLTAAAAASSLPNWIASALAGTVPAAPDWGVWTVGISAALCYVFGARGARAAQDPPKRRLLWVLPAALVGVAAAALAVVAIGLLAAGRLELNASRLSVVRTTLNCALALSLGFLGSRWKHVELGWVAYAAVAFGTLKLLFEDLRFGNAASLVVSLLFYGLILILLPSLMRRSRAGS